MAGSSVALERLIDRLHDLDEMTLSEISDFVEFVIQKKEKKRLELVDAVRRRALPPVMLERLCEDLSTIKGSLSDVVTQLRQELGGKGTPPSAARRKCLLANARFQSHG
jgi:hypothetical protein